MKEQQLTALMERAADGLGPDVEALVAGGAVRGRRALRRRRLASGIGAAAAVGAIAVAATMLTGGGGPAATDPGVAGPPTTNAPAGAQRELADRTVIKERLLDLLPEGDVSNVKIRSSEDGRAHVSARLLLNGAEVNASITDASPHPEEVSAPGPKPADCDESEVPIGEGVITIDELEAALNELGQRMQDEAFRACVEWVVQEREFQCAQDGECWEHETTAARSCDSEDPADAHCMQLADGSWLRSGTQATHEDDPERAAEWATAWAVLSTTDQWDIDLDAGAPARGAAPILSEEQLVELVQSDIWFE